MSTKAIKAIFNPDKILSIFDMCEIIKNKDEYKVNKKR